MRIEAPVITDDPIMRAVIDANRARRRRGWKTSAAYRDPDPPGSRSEPRDYERSNENWREFCARIDEEAT